MTSEVEEAKAEALKVERKADSEAVECATASATLNKTKSL